MDFSQATAVPSLSSTNAFSNTNNYYRIVVPNALYDQWIAATNWSDSSIVTHIEKAIKGLVFKAGAANSTVALTAVGTPTSIDIEYSTDGGTTFSPYTVGTTITLTSVDDTVMFRAGSTGQTALADDSSNYHKFVMTGSISVDDSLVWLFNRQGTEPQALADYAFYGLFNGCAVLQNAPELPFTSLGDYSYAYMFAGCTGLTTAPELPATTLGDYCYSNMFNGCTGLTTAPTLANTSLTEGCYEGMFKGCTSITEAPTLPATTLATGCYNEMFYGCSSLDTISLGYTGNFSTTYFNDWMYGVAASGTFVYFGQDTTVGTSAIPSGWNVVGWNYDGFTFKAEQAGSTVRLVKNSGAPDVTLQYTTDSINWQDYTVGDTITLPNAGNKVGFRAKTTNAAFGNNTNTSFNGWVGTGQLSVSGNINSLLDKDNYATLTDISSRQRVFNWMFYNMTSLVSAEDLTLPCTTIGKFAYNNMFQGCTNMTKAPKEIAATTISGTTGDWPMAGMFKGCTSITKSPYFHFTNINSNTNAFQELFNGCSNLNEIKLDYTGNFGTGTWTDWVNGVAASGTFYYNGSDTTVGTNAIPSGWTVSTFTPPWEYKNYINTNIAEMNTGVIPTTDTKVVGRFRGSAVGNWFVGSSDAKWRGFNSQNTFYVDLNGMGARISQSGWDTTKWYDVEFGNFYFNCVPVDGGTTISQSSTARSFTHTTPLMLGSATYSWAGEYEQFDCAGFKIYEGNTLVKDYRPAVDGNGVACFHEEVSGTFAYPSSGTFLAY